MSKIKRPKGRTGFPVGSRHCQCGACGQRFESDSAFQYHRMGPQDARYCLSPEQMIAVGMIRNGRKLWIRGGGVQASGGNTRLEASQRH